jgi:heme/copper-type cytochrome/quinol oxidase subunit 3
VDRLFAGIAVVTFFTLLSAYRDYRAVIHNGSPRAAKLTARMVLGQEATMLVITLILLLASILRIVTAAPEPGLSIIQSICYCAVALLMLTMALIVARYRHRILAAVESLPEVEP